MQRSSTATRKYAPLRSGSELEPGGTSGAEPTAQALKSARTRARLIDATIRCLVKYSYANTTTLKVAEEAGLSRGAMLHHFENGRQLMQATLIELHQKRLRAFRRAAGTMERDARTLLGAYWAQLLRPSFIAFQELALASRTDRELAATLEPVRQEFREKWQNVAIELFPEWLKDERAFRIALAITQNTLEGMAVNRLTFGIDEDTITLVLDHLEQQILALRPKAD